MEIFLGCLRMSYVALNNGSSLDCRDARSLPAGCSSSVKLSRFFDKVIQRRYFSREAASPFKPNKSFSYSAKYYHND